MALDMGLKSPDGPREVAGEPIEIGLPSCIIRSSKLADLHREEDAVQGAFGGFEACSFQQRENVFCCWCRRVLLAAQIAVCFEGHDAALRQSLLRYEDVASVFCFS
jgi:hypothetical protein